MPEANECVFCQLLAGKLEISLVYQDNLCSAFMDIQPVNAGHILVVPNRHATFLADLDENEGAQMFRVAQRLAAAICSSGLKCEGVNLLLANGKAAGQAVFHVHLHVFPRFQNDGFGFKFSSTYAQKPSREKLNEAAERIKKALEQTSNLKDNDC